MRPNAGIAADYQRRLFVIVDAMARSYVWWLVAQYREAPPRIAQDETPAKQMTRELNRLGKRWQKQIDDAAPQLAKWFAKSASKRSEGALRKILRDSGMSVKFDPTRVSRDVMDAIVAQNVSLIRSIPEAFHSKVEGVVMRSITTGRDLKQLTRDLQKQFKVERKRAELIAIDQNNKATSAMMRVRQTELGIETGTWMHSNAGKTQRKTHVANNGKTFSIAEGWFDPDPKVRKNIWPGELIHCHCTWRPNIKGFS